MQCSGPSSREPKSPTPSGGGEVGARSRWSAGLAPHYNSSTHNLEWSLKGRDEDGQVVVNHYTRFLGRRGVMTVDFVAGIDNFSTQLVTFKGAMDGFAYTRDNSYLAFVQGDKLAEYGLTGLVVGGTAIRQGRAVQILWKLIVAAFAAQGHSSRNCSDRKTKAPRSTGRQPMIGSLDLVLAIAALYLVECLRRVGPYELTLDRRALSGFRLKRPAPYPNDTRWGWVLLNPFRPDGPRSR